MRRRLLQALAAAPLVAAWRSAGGTAATPLHLAAPEPIARLHAGATGGLLAVSSTGVLWEYTGQAWTRRAAGLDVHSPLASGHGRIAGRSAQGTLWVLEGERLAVSPGPALSRHAGLHIQALGVIAVAAGDRNGGHVVRLEADASGAWGETARCSVPVLPDADPVQANLDTGGTAEDGHIVVLAGPDAQRYRHGVLGDAIEATRLLYLERHDLTLRRSLVLPAPYVFEDRYARPIAVRGGVGVALVRSGPQGGGLVVVRSDPGHPQRLHIVAEGDPLGTAHRWMAPTTDGRHLLAVHTPHIGGRLHAYRIDGHRLRARALANGVTNHVLGTRELDLGAWINGLLLVPTQDRRQLRVFDAAQDFSEGASIALAGPVAATRALRLGDRDGLAVLQEDGTVWWAGPLT